MVTRETIFIGNILSTAILFLQLNFPAYAQSDSACKQFGPRGQLIDIGGWRLHIYGKEYDSLKGPAVILEAGIGSFSFDWDLVQTQLAPNNNVYSYDRAGSAWSDLGPRPHTMHQAVYDLHTLLHKARIPASDPAEQERKKEQFGLLSLSKNSRQIIAEKSGHHIQLDQPELVADAIKQVIESVSKKQKLK